MLGTFPMLPERSIRVGIPIYLCNKEGASLLVRRFGSLVKRSLEFVTAGTRLKLVATLQVSSLKDMPTIVIAGIRERFVIRCALLDEGSFAQFESYPERERALVEGRRLSSSAKFVVIQVRAFLPRLQKVLPCELRRNLPVERSLRQFHEEITSAWTSFSDLILRGQSCFCKGQTNPAGADGEGNSQEAEHQHEPQRQVVRRFQFAIQIDLGLILKLAAVVFLFNQEGSRQRLITLLLSALLIYLYQTGALAPILRWLRRAGAPPQQQAAVRPENAPVVVQDDAYERQPENVGAENQNQPIENERQIGNENHVEVGRPNGVELWEIAREIKMVIVGFVVSLFPGFHHHND
ncbi:hypothetical protein Taro_040771 [Colocasia esculenta]|uniref:Uncharacterized protein n=1 Tax=Colocasia esculenta TaxID=4460 RepID=A0A843WRD6_COLES|nr:hypothetical protein [Colocasia esculenta]